MPLINCPECQKQVSDKATSCPNCGHPLSPTPVDQQPQKPISPQPASKKKNNGYETAVLIFIGVITFLIIVWLLTGNNSVNNTNNTGIDSITANKPDEVVNKPIIDTVKSNELSKLFIVKKDEFEGYSWVQPKNRPIYDNSNGFYCYFAKDKDGVYNLRFKGQYAAKDWLFAKYLKFNIDNESVDFFPDKIETDHDSGIWEWFDQKVDSNMYNLLVKISNAKTVKVRWYGQQYYDDKIISSSYIKSIKNTLEYYKSLGGTVK